LTFTPATDSNGMAKIYVRLGDDGGTENGGVDSSVIDSFVIVVSAVNDAPKIVSVPADLSTPEETAISLEFSSFTVTDVDNVASELFLVAGIGENYTIDEDGVTILPGKDFNGTLEVPLSVYDGQFYSNSVTVTIAVTPVNDPPVVANAMLAATEDETATVSLTGTDDGKVVADSLMQGPSHGTASFSGTILTYVPDADYNGFDTLSWLAIDDSGAVSSEAAFLFISVAAVNDAPTLTVAMDTVNLYLGASHYMALRSDDVDGTVESIAIAQFPSHGSALLSGKTLHYEPNSVGFDSAGFVAEDDGNDYSDTLWIYFNVMDYEETSSSSSSAVWLSLAASSSEGGTSSSSLSVSSVCVSSSRVSAVSSIANASSFSEGGASSSSLSVSSVCVSSSRASAVSSIANASSFSEGGISSSSLSASSVNVSSSDGCVVSHITSISSSGGGRSGLIRLSSSTGEGSSDASAILPGMVARSAVEVHGTCIQANIDTKIALCDLIGRTLWTKTLRAGDRIQWTGSAGLYILRYPGVYVLYRVP
ncbi:MAG TPA: Ig-like domain-containing protein, partial [Fibrobacteraceae bacterium]|nr:Ig-like domain-containing protein [Fibrobacteraceae bacterium]